MVGEGLLACIGIVLVLSVIAILYYAVGIFNGLIQLRNNIDKSWANMEVLLKQRHDEIPNVVETVKGYAKHEKDLFEKVAKVRSFYKEDAGVAEKASFDQMEAGVVKSLFAVAENYPQLMASDNFLALQKRIAELENEIADRREHYNDSVLLYNTKLGVIPDGAFAFLLRFKTRDYFKVSEEEGQQVKLGL